MGKKYKGDFKACLDEANQFMEVVDWLSKDIPFINKYSFAINLSLACELYIKALQIHYDANNMFVSGHNLKELYAHLPNQVKQRINYQYRKKMPKDRWMSVGEVLKLHGDIFTDWRYSFQKGSKKSTLRFSEYITLVRIIQARANDILHIVS